MHNMEEVPGRIPKIPPSPSPLPAKKGQDPALSLASFSLPLALLYLAPVLFSRQFAWPKLGLRSPQRHGPWVWPLVTSTSRGAFSILNPKIRIFLEHLRKPSKKRPVLEKRTMVEKKGESTPRKLVRGHVGWSQNRGTTGWVHPTRPPPMLALPKHQVAPAMDGGLGAKLIGPRVLREDTLQSVPLRLGFPQNASQPRVGCKSM